ncbi:MAG: ATP-binding cassette domain-containing protein, partial [Proteobacteria bacterium]|nr:ATP-binding cassette domain-containing protein [Pseudomonadota bacterium]
AATAKLNRRHPARFGRRESLDAVRRAGGASRDGIDAAGLIATAAQFGLAGNAYRVELDELATLPLPQILHWEFNHFVVLDGIDAGGFTINDPARGRRRITRAEMDRAFTGITLVFEPTAAFTSARAGEGLLRTLWRTLAESRAAAANIILTGLLVAATGILLTSASRIFVDEYLGQERRQWLLVLLVGMAGLAVMRGAITWAGAQIALFLQTRINALISSRIVWTLLRLPFPFLSSRSPAEISTRMQIAGQIAGVASGPFLGIVNNIVLILAYGLAMLAYSPWLTSFVMAIALANLVILRLVDRAVMDANADAQMAVSKAHATNIRGIGLVEEARATGIVPLLFRRLLDAFVDETNAQQRAARVRHRLGAIPFFCANLLSLVVLCAGAYEVMRSEMTIGTLLAFQMLAELFAAPLAALVGLGSAVLSVSGGIARTNDLLGGNPRPTPPADALPFDGQRLEGRITVDGVAFAHRSRPPLFADLSFEIAPGSLVLIVGETGSGKTSLAMILAGVLAPTAGSVRFDGKASDEIPAEVFRHSVGLADHAPFFPAGVLRDALTLWDFGPTTQQLETALRDAAMEEAVRLRPGGLASRIGEGGMGFSGGELQRLAIARALAQSPSILILDDATTALDRATERRILENLRARGITVVMVSGRRDLADQFDAVIELRAPALREAA